MPVKRMRQAVAGRITAGELEQMRAEGWQLVALEWERPEEPAESGELVEAPFGLQVAKGPAALEPNPAESEALLTMLELIIQEGPYWRVADELNRRGHRTRSGAKWSPVSVFEMLPRLIEAAPHIFSSPVWEERRKRQTTRQ